MQTVYEYSLRNFHHFKWSVCSIVRSRNNQKHPNTTFSSSVISQQSDTRPTWQIENCEPFAAMTNVYSAKQYLLRPLAKCDNEDERKWCSSSSSSSSRQHRCSRAVLMISKYRRLRRGFDQVSVDICITDCRSTHRHQPIKLSVVLVSADGAHSHWVLLTLQHQLKGSFVKVM